MFGQIVRKVAFALAAGLLLLPACFSQSRALNGTVEGIVTNSSAQPVSGAFVKLKNADRRLTFMVISQADGHFVADKLPPGSYTVQGVGAGFESSWSEAVDVVEGKPGKVNLSLTTKEGPMLAPAWPGKTPEYGGEDPSSDNLPDGKGQQLVSERCSTCHSTSVVANSRKDRETWKRTISTMRRNMKDANLKDLSEEEADTILNYVAINFPPLPKPDPNSRLPRTLMKGEATRYKVVEYDLVNTKAETHDIAVDPDGTGWANQRVGGLVGRLDPSTLEYSEINPPLTKGQAVRPGNLQISSQGIMWLPDGGDGNRWLSYDIKNAKWTSYPYPTTMRAHAGGNTMAIAPDGVIWNSGPGAARSFNPKTGEWKNYDSPTWLKSGGNPGGYGIAVATDGMVWFAEEAIDKMARVDPKTGKVEEFKIPISGVALPRRLAADTHDNVWVGLWSAGKLLKIDSETAEMSVYTPPSENSGAYSVSVDKTNDLIWVNLHRVDKIARFNPRTKEWVEFPLPQAESDVRRIEVDQHHPNRIWFSGVGDSAGDGQARMGYIELLEGAATK